MEAYTELHGMWRKRMGFPFVYGNQSEVANLESPFCAYVVEQLTFPKGFSVFRNPERNTITIPRRDKISYALVSEVEGPNVSSTGVVSMYNKFIGYTYTPEFREILEKHGFAAQRFEKGLDIFVEMRSPNIQNVIKVLINYVYFVEVPMFYANSTDSTAAVTGPTIETVRVTNTTTSTPIEAMRTPN